MVELINGLAPSVAREPRAGPRRIAAAGRDPAEVEILAAVKYVPAEELAARRGRDRARGREPRPGSGGQGGGAPGRFAWHFIGPLQCRKVRRSLPHVRYIHSVATDSALAQLGRHGRPARGPGRGQRRRRAGKAGSPRGAASFLDRCPVTVVGLMTMPPLAPPSRSEPPPFAALRELAREHGLRQLSMGTSQDYVVAVEEGPRSCGSARALYRAAARHNHGQGIAENHAKPRTDMAFRDPWHRTLVYFGLAEDDAYEEDDEPYNEPEAEAPGQLPRAPERPPAQPRRRRDEFDDIFADDAERRAAHDRHCGR